MSEAGHAPSLWAATAASPPETLPLRGERDADCVVIGGGYTGLSTALHLAEAGQQAVVLEAAEIGWGASGRNNGQVIPTLSRADPADLVKRFGKAKGEAFAGVVRDSAALVFDLIRKHGIECEAVQNGWIQPAHSPGRFGLAKRRVEQWGALGAPVELLEKPQLDQMLGSDYWHGGWMNRTGGHINPLGYARGLARAAIAAGAAVYTRAPATRLERRGDAWRVETPEGAVTAPKVVVATGTYSDDLWPGLKQTVVPIRSYQMATTPISDNVRKSIVPGNQAVSDTHGDLYFFRWDAQGRLVSGGALLVQIADDTRIKRRIAARLQRLFPQLGEVTFDYVWNGYVGATQDKIPHLHQLAPGVIGWIGCNGRGVAFATIMGHLLAEAVQGRPVEDLPVPTSPLEPISGHGIVRHLARGMLLLYRWNDAKEWRAPA